MNRPVGVVVIDNSFARGLFLNMKAVLLLRERHVLAEDVFAGIRIWRVPEPVPASDHAFKYSLALVARRVCVLRYDNEAGKGDHRHLGDEERPYAFRSPDGLIADFWKDADQWMKQAGW